MIAFILFSNCSFYYPYYYSTPLNIRMILRNKWYIIEWYLPSYVPSASFVETKRTGRWNPIYYGLTLYVIYIDKEKVFEILMVLVQRSCFFRCDTSNFRCFFPLSKVFSFTPKFESPPSSFLGQCSLI